MKRDAERRGRLILVAALLLTALVYAPALTNPFTYDDVPLVVQNGLLRDAAGLRVLLTTTRVTTAPVPWTHFRPLLMATFWLDYQVGGAAPFGYRLVNLLLHLLNGVLVDRLLRFALSRHLPESRAPIVAAVAAGLFLLHPIRAITVDLVLKRNTLLCWTLLLTALLLLARADRARRAGTAALAPCIAALLCGALALLAKEEAVALPLLVAVGALFTGAPLRSALPFTVAPGLFSLLFFPHGVVDPGSGLGHLLSQPLAWAGYLRMLVDPGAIAAAYDLQPVAHPLPAVRLAALALTVALLGAALLARRRAPLVASAVLWFAATLLPTSVIPVRVTMDEVRCYGALLLADAALATALVALSDRIAGATHHLRSAPFLAAAPLLLGATLLAAATLSLHLLWSTPVELFTHAVSRYPASPVANALLCEEELHAGLLDRSIPQCAEAARLAPDDTFVTAARVESLARAARTPEAQSLLAAALTRAPGDPTLTLTQASLAWFQDDLPVARAAYQRVLASDPSNETARLYLADIALRTQDIPTATALLHSFDHDPPATPELRQLLETLLARR